MVLDLTKAFDTVDHELLKLKFKAMGIIGGSFEWLCSYLDNRRQAVKVNGATSDFKTLLIGIPQGSVLRPTLFNIFINDITNSCLSINFNLYADDTIISLTGNNLLDLLKEFNLKLINVSDWLKNNKLIINMEKTFSILFHTKRPQPITYNNHVLINGKKLPYVKSFKYLGITIDNTLTWNQHIYNTRLKLTRTLAIFHRLKCYLSYKSLYQAYYALFHSHLNYCLLTWGTSSKNKLKPISHLQNKVLKILNKAGELEFGSNFPGTNIPNIEQIYKLQLGMVFYDLKSNLLPLPIKNILTKIDDSPNHSYELRIINPRLPSLRTELGRGALPYKLSTDYIYFNETFSVYISRNTFKLSIKDKILNSV